MPDPIVFVVTEDVETTKALAGALDRRFGADYRILGETDGASALRHLSPKGVAAVVADGSIAIRFIREYLTEK